MRTFVSLGTIVVSALLLLLVFSILDPGPVSGEALGERRFSALESTKVNAIAVASPANSGAGSLREAINLANGTGNVTITFDTAVFPPNLPTTIFLQSSLPSLVANNITIDASNAGVILDGSQAPAGSNGLIINADGCAVRGVTIRSFSSNGIIIDQSAADNVIGGDRNAGAGPNGQGNLIINNGGSGVDIRGAGSDNNLLRGNYIGVDASGMWDAGNALNGVSIWQGAADNVVGGASDGQRNVIGGNDQNGVWIGGASTEQNRVIGNYLGTRANGLAPLGNGFAGVAVQTGAHDNWIGGTGSGEGNLISGNWANGIYLSDAGTENNHVLGNIIGPDRQGTGVIGQGLNGIAIALGAGNNNVGDGSVNGRNLISGNTHDGVRIEDDDTMGNVVQGNYIGVNISGTAALANGLHGVDLAEGAHDNLIGGNRLLGQGNLLSGNENHGLVITYGAHHNTASGNLIGPDAGGTYAIGNQEFGGVDVAEGAHDNVIGGLGAGEGNIISGNQTDGIALFSNGADTADNQVLGNRIGLALSGDIPLPNAGDGIANVSGAVGTLMEGNTIAYNEGNGIWVAPCTGNTITQNSIYSNELLGIKTSCATMPQLSAVSLTTLTGTADANGRIEFFSDDEDEGRIYEGFAIADGGGAFTFTRPGGFAGPNVTATSTDVNGNTSAFSAPRHLRWTMLLYLNGDNNLESFMSEAKDSLYAAGPPPRANVLLLLDERGDNNSRLYDVTYGNMTPMSHTFPLTGSMGSAGELNMGDGDTLSAFVNWGRARYPVSYTMLSIVDHGGGWSPSSDLIESGIITEALGYRRTGWLAGGSGLSWDETTLITYPITYTAGGMTVTEVVTDYDYLESPEITAAMAAIDAEGGPLDVVFYDVCLMGMVEVAYQIQDHASFFVSAQNIGWAPTGENNRYVRMLAELAPDATPRDMSALLVRSYARAMPLSGHPFTASAVDLAQLPGVTTAVSQLGATLSDTLATSAQAEFLQTVYNETQKVDYDSDFQIEPTKEGFVDLGDFAQHVSGAYADTGIVNAAQSVLTALETAVVTVTRRSGAPWFDPGLDWNLDDVSGLSIFLPLGEDLEYEILITDTSPISPNVTITRLLRMRDVYSGHELQFVEDNPIWINFIDAFYERLPAPPMTPDGPVDGLQLPDVAPPTTLVTVTGAPAPHAVLTFTWSSTDTQTGVYSATLWHELNGVVTGDTSKRQIGASGLFTGVLGCGVNRFAVRAVDKVGNVEPVGGSNTAVFNTLCDTFLPTVRKD